MSPRPPPATCANCGAAIPSRARVCPHCGADERTGWRESSIYDGIDLPDAAFDDESSRRPARHARRTVPWYWLVTALVLAVGLILAAIALG